MAIRTRFSRTDQDQLASFLATHPANPRGKAIYREFAQTHTKHTWNSWRQHYLSNSTLFNKAIQRKKRALRTTPAPSDQELTQRIYHNHLDRNPGLKHCKGKEVARIEVFEINSDSDLSENPISIPSRQTLTPQQEFTLQRIPSNPHNQFNTTSTSSSSSSSSSSYPYNFNQLSLPTYQPGKSRWDPRVRVIPLSREEEDNLFTFISGYPKGDLRLCSILYEMYHLQAPEFTPEEYRTYYLTHQHKVGTQRPVSAARESIAPVYTPVVRMSGDGIREDEQEEDESDQEEQRTMKSPPVTVSPPSSTHYLEDDEIGLDEILNCSDHPKIAALLDLSQEKLEFFLNLPRDLFQSWEVR